MTEIIDSLLLHGTSAPSEGGYTVTLSFVNKVEMKSALCFHTHAVHCPQSKLLTTSWRFLTTLLPIHYCSWGQESVRWTTPSCSPQSSQWRLGHWQWLPRRHSLLTLPPWPRWCDRSLCGETCGGSQTPWCRGQWRSPWRWCLATKQMW